MAFAGYFFEMQFTFLLPLIVSLVVPGLGLANNANTANTVDVRISLESAKSQRLISEGIYGLGTYMREKHDDENVWNLRPSGIRFGGNTSERFNWKLNSWNAGKDWYFRNFSSSTPNMIDTLIKRNRGRSVATYVTVPLLGWVAKDSVSGSFPKTRYPDQADFNDGFGNGIKANGDKIVADPTNANVAIDDAFVSDWIRHLAGVYGDSPHYYIIGNEPMLWHETHRDVHPEPATYDEVFKKFSARAKAIRLADPKAVIIGPALWGFLATQQSAFDQAGPWSNWKKGVDRARHGGQPFLEWFLKSLVAEEKRIGMSLIDVVDIHYYPENQLVRKGPPAENRTRKARLESTRSLWDRTYVDDSWIRESLYFIPRFRELITSIKPGLKLAIGEYNFYAERDESGGVALAEVLGIFGRERLDFGMYWTIPPAESPASFAFRLYRNYDGKDAQFGNIVLDNSVGILPEVSVFSALRSADGAVTAVVLNKSLSAAKTFRIRLSGTTDPQEARVFAFNAQRKALVPLDVSSKAGVLEFALDPLTMAVLEIKR